MVEPLTRGLFTQLIDGLIHIKNMGYLHVGISSDNILLDADLHIKISGVEKAQKIKDDGEQPLKELKSISQYRAPETFSGETYDAEKAIAFALGVILFKMQFHRNPFKDGNVLNAKEYSFFM